MKNNFNWRINLILVIVFILGTAIVSRLFYLQILNRKLYESQALGQQVSFKNIVGPRGQIFCENSQETKGNKSSGEVKGLAINKESWKMVVNPKNVSDKNVFAENLSEVLEKTKEEILSQIDNENSYVVLGKDLSSEKMKKIKSLGFKGVSWENESNRFYPQGQLASHVLGFVGGADSGQYGIEGYYEDILKGKLGIQEDKKGLDSLFSDNNDEASLDGSDVYLTIDYNIQFQAESLLAQEKEKNDIDSGQIIVIKPSTGKILALANFPSYDPNYYSKEKDLGIFQNSVIQKLFEPGSVMKPFTMAAALNEGKITPETTYVDTGSVVIGKDVVSNFNFEKEGEQTMTGVLENSLNTGAVFVEQKLDHKVFWDYLDKFGFFQKTNIDSQGEAYSINELLRTGPDFNYATASFGQGIEMTPIQLVKAFCALANGGKTVKPYLVEKIVNGRDEVYTRPEISSPIISQQAISQLNSMLVNVVDKGFGGVAKIPGYYLAGKTGTAQIPKINGRGYEPDSETIQSFVGYGPAYNPQFLILVKLDRPKVPKSSLSAVPVFKELARYIINYWQIPPDYDPATKK